MLNILNERVIRTTLTRGDTARLSLPQVYDAMAADAVAGFPGLRRHQEHAWHALLAQLGAIASHAGGRDRVPTGAAGWHKALSRLTGGADGAHAWNLIEPDVHKCAFLQPAASPGMETYRRRVPCPDDLDVLVTAANHDVKRSVARCAQADDWIFTLVSVQTCGDYQGGGKQRIVRMNGGHSSRAGVGLAPADGDRGAHLFHDIRRMLQRRERLLERYRTMFAAEGGLALLWTAPWRGDDPLPLDGGELDPYFVEVCRQIRLAEEDGEIVGWDRTTKAPRIDGKAAAGNVGDFWTPVNAQKNTALHVTEDGFDYRRLAAILFDKARYDLPDSMRIEPHARGSWRLVARGLAGGEGKTGGYHEAVGIQFSGRTAKALARSEERGKLAAIAKSRVEDAGRIGYALKQAIKVGAGSRGGSKSREVLGENQARVFGRHLSEGVTVVLFRSIEEEYEARDEAGALKARAEFVRWMLRFARTSIAVTTQTGQRGGVWRHKAAARARDTFEAIIRGKESPLRGLNEILKPEARAND